MAFFTFATSASPRRASNAVRLLYIPLVCAARRREIDRARAREKEPVYTRCVCARKRAKDSRGELCTLRKSRTIAAVKGARACTRGSLRTARGQWQRAGGRRRRESHIILHTELRDWSKFRRCRFARQPRPDHRGFLPGSRRRGHRRDIWPGERESTRDS